MNPYPICYLNAETGQNLIVLAHAAQLLTTSSKRHPTGTQIHCWTLFIEIKALAPTCFAKLLMVWLSMSVHWLPSIINSCCMGGQRLQTESTSKGEADPRHVIEKVHICISNVEPLAVSSCQCCLLRRFTPITWRRYVWHHQREKQHPNPLMAISDDFHLTPLCYTF